MALSAYPSFESIGGANMVYDSELSGYWAYPDGSVVSCAPDEFTQACKAYGINGRSGSETSFMLPSISGFVKANPAFDTAVPMRKVSF